MNWKSADLIPTPGTFALSHIHCLVVLLSFGCITASGEQTTQSLHIQKAADSRYGPLKPAAGITQPPASERDFDERRREMQALLIKYLGPFPPDKCELKPRVLREDQLDGYKRLKVRYLTQPGEDVTAFLLVPDNATTGSTPAVIAAHQTSESAKEEVCGLTGKPSMHYGLDLVRRGYIVLAPDSITAGERIYAGYEPFETAAFDKANPEWSAIGKMIWDHRRGLDYLETLPRVDKTRIGAIGHSLGAYNAFFLAAFDDRIKAVVESCGYCTIASDDGRERWARTSWFVHIPRLRPFVEPGSKLKPPFDFQEVLALVAPRPLFQSVGLRDDIFKSADSAAQVHVALQPIYKALGKPDNLDSYFFDGPHDFPPEAKQRAYEFLDRHLKRQQ